VDVGNTDLSMQRGRKGLESCPVTVCVTDVDSSYFAVNPVLVTRFLSSLVRGLRGKLVIRAALRRYSSNNRPLLNLLFC
jgi:hypothetical protein